MKRVSIILFLIGLVAVGGWIVWNADFSSTPDIVPRILGSAAAVDTPYVAPPVVNDYQNDEFRFSLKIPDGFTAGELPVDENGAKTILLQNSAGEGIQIYITPQPGAPNSLTAADVRASIPDMEVTNEQVVEIGTGNTGVAFISDNEAFGGASREVWFYFRGHLYQISTYAHLDPLLQAMFGTWKFF